MKSTEMQISVYRNNEGVPCFRYPKDWNGEKIFEQISELCATLQEELISAEMDISLLRYRHGKIKAKEGEQK